ncbi:GNAT family N-acetyltransferase [Prochlorothrix hollandica]|uniref:GCN5 family acetyltransferase n=1 Tax=Prochlorothrix hollandica PCC 9006 = CALU 1027 TaxID=317619 RepID=A0A0M2Q070_PROHO|nr:N-acetyltransferase [Prochlorothrix hollandica]KKJ00329.1 GCN5 family acetyltransferase [Prochlorothrix hollandica PCC 9006 = CALU 1027]
MIIRPEQTCDIAAITEVTIAAFQTLEISNNTEQFIIQALRQANALTLSLVADIDRQVVGHIAFSPVTISDGSPQWYGLGPVSVVPEYQNQGIGTALIQEGLSLLKTSGAQGCVLVGYPAYYQRFWFRNSPTLIYGGIPPEFFLALAFDRPIPQGNVTFHPGFSATSDAAIADTLF